MVPSPHRAGSYVQDSRLPSMMMHHRVPLYMYLPCLSELYLLRFLATITAIPMSRVVDIRARKEVAVVRQFRT